MNWYKKAQVQEQIIDYHDIGHWWTTPGDLEEIGEKMITLWVSDMVGSSFQMVQIHPNDPDTHQDHFSIGKNFWGRHDPFQPQPTSSINIPYFPNRGPNQLDPDDIPDRLVRTLKDKWPESSVWAFPYQSKPIQIA